MALWDRSTGGSVHHTVRWINLPAVIAGDSCAARSTAGFQLTLPAVSMHQRDAAVRADVRTAPASVTVIQSDELRTRAFQTSPSADRVEGGDTVQSRKTGGLTIGMLDAERYTLC